MNQAVIITENKYPLGDAGAIRQHATAKILQELGFCVTVVGYGKYTGNTLNEYEGVKYISLRAKSENKFVRLFYRLLFSFRAVRYVKKHIEKPSVILLVDTLPYGWKLVESYGVKNNVKLIHDSVEWYSPEEFSNGEKNIEYKLKEMTNSKIINKNWNVIAISKFLQNHFVSIAENVVRIPVIMDTDSILFKLEKKNTTKKLSFAYVGAPAKKDYLKEILEGFDLLEEEYKDLCELHIIGITESQLINDCGVDKNLVANLNKVLQIHGRLPHGEAIKWVREADHTLLLRDADLRYAKAGFPTKIVESLSCGTPPVCNFSSDLDMYLKDGENSFISESHRPEDLKNTLTRAINCSLEQRNKMRKSARKTAEEFFDYKNYIEIFRELL